MELTMKSLVTFEVKCEDRTYNFTMPAGAKAGEVYDVLMEFLQKVVSMSQESVKAMERTDKSGTDKIAS